MKKIICDKCGEKAIDNPPLLHLFDGSLNIANIDLCQKCYDNLQTKIERFEGK